MVASLCGGGNMFLYYVNFHHLSFFKVGIAPGDKYASLTSNNVSKTLLQAYNVDWCIQTLSQVQRYLTFIKQRYTWF